MGSSGLVAARSGRGGCGVRGKERASVAAGVPDAGPWGVRGSRSVDQRLQVLRLQMHVALRHLAVAVSQHLLGEGDTLRSPEAASAMPEVVLHEVPADPRTLRRPLERISQARDPVTRDML